jgi:phosphoglucosamine mutase
MTNSKQYFGTDGIRGRFGVAPITPDFALKLGWAAGTVLAGNKGPILIGKDTRASGAVFEAALEAGLLAAGVDVIQLGIVPTPAVAFLTRHLKAQAGIVISASHNPHMDNGIKLFSSQGEKLGDDLELAIEAQLTMPTMQFSKSTLGKVIRQPQLIAEYQRFCLDSVPSTLDLSGISLALDCAHGATYQVAPRVLEALGAQVCTLGVAPNGTNINADVGSIA